jgi:hypothetical protein
MRPSDVPEVRGTAERLSSVTGWAAEIPLEQTVADAVGAWRDSLSAQRR